MLHVRRSAGRRSPTTGCMWPTPAEAYQARPSRNPSIAIRNSRASVASAKVWECAAAFQTLNVRITPLQQSVELTDQAISAGPVVAFPDRRPNFSVCREVEVGILVVPRSDRVLERRELAKRSNVAGFRIHATAYLIADIGDRLVMAETSLRRHEVGRCLT